MEIAHLWDDTVITKFMYFKIPACRFVSFQYLFSFIYFLIHFCRMHRCRFQLARTSAIIILECCPVAMWSRTANIAAKSTKVEKVIHVFLLLSYRWKVHIYEVQWLFSLQNSCILRFCLLRNLVPLILFDFSMFIIVLFFISTQYIYTGIPRLVRQMHFACTDVRYG